MDSGSSGQLYSVEAIVLSHCNDNREKTIRMGKKCFYLKDSEYIPIYQWQQALLGEEVSKLSVTFPKDMNMTELYASVLAFSSYNAFFLPQTDCVHTYQNPLKNRNHQIKQVLVAEPFICTGFASTITKLTSFTVAILQPRQGLFSKHQVLKWTWLPSDLLCSGISSDSLTSALVGERLNRAEVMWCFAVATLHINNSPLERLLLDIIHSVVW